MLGQRLVGGIVFMLAAPVALAGTGTAPAPPRAGSPPAHAATGGSATTKSATPKTAAPSAPRLTAEQIVEKSVAARGGLQAWRAVQTLSFSGMMDAGGKHDTQLPFAMQLKRPRKTRLEIDFAHDKAIQVYDGAQGYKLRPYLGRRDVEPFTPEELEAAAMEADLDGPLVDHVLKNIAVKLDAVEKVDGQDAYKLSLTMNGGKVRHLWVDAQSFLEVKIEGTSRKLDGKLHTVEVYYHDYRDVQGLKIPYVLESRVHGVVQTRKIFLDKVQVNPPLDDALFTKAPLDEIAKNETR